MLNLFQHLIKSMDFSEISRFGGKKYPFIPQAFNLVKLALFYPAILGEA